MLHPDTQAPALDLPCAGGGRFRLAEQAPDGFTMLVFYRGKHCPICHDYLETIAGKLDTIGQRGIVPVAISMDSAERAAATQTDWVVGGLPLGYGLTEDQAREWGLFISTAREGSDEPARFSEPGLFLVRPDGRLFFVAVQSAPFTRPPIDDLLENIDFVMEHDYPARGTATALAD